MAVLKILIAPDPKLHEVAKPVAQVNNEIKKIIKDLHDTMLDEGGAGIAATQVGINKRIFLMDISSYIPEIKDLYIIINPEIKYASEEKWIEEEGCLSFPIIGRVPIERSENIIMTYIDYNGKKCEINASGWLARGFLHEIDHLNGVTMIDHVSKLKQSYYIRKLNKYKKLNNIA